MPGQTSLLTMLTVDGTPLSVDNGGQPPIPNFELSKLHDTYSIDGIPHVDNEPAPSQLDLNSGYPTENGAYMDNLPT